MRNAGADPENIEPWGANGIKYRPEPGGTNYFFSITYKGEQGACAGCAHQAHAPSKYAPAMNIKKFKKSALFLQTYTNIYKTYTK